MFRLLSLALNQSFIATLGKTVLKKLYHSSIFNSWFSAFVGLISSVIAIPIVITELTVEEINVWFLFTSIIALSKGVEFGFNNTFTRFIVYVNNGVKIEDFKDLRHKKSINYEEVLNNSDFSRVFFLMESVYVFLSIIFCMILMLIGYFTLDKPINDLVKPNSGWIAACIVLISSTLTLLFGYYKNFMLGLNKVALVQRVSGVVNLIGLIFILCVLFFEPTLISIVLIYQLVSLANLFMVIYLAKKEIKIIDLKKGNDGFDKALFLIVWESAWKSGITTIIANIVKHISAILVSQLFSPSVSASFLFTKRIFDIIERFTMTTFQARVPVIAKYRGRGDFDSLVPCLKQTQYITYCVFFFGYVSLLIGGEYVLHLIGSNVSLGSYTLIIFFSFATFLARWSGVGLAITNQSNHVIEHINAIIVVIVFFSVFFLLYPILGIEVFPFAQIISMIVIAPFIAKYVYKSFHSTFWGYEKTVFVPLFVILALINLIYYWYNI